MKTQILAILVMSVISSAAFAGPKACSNMDGDISETIHCLEGELAKLSALNNIRLEKLSTEEGLSDVQSLRNSTEIRKKVCSIQSSANPFGGRGQALNNRQCFLAQELKLEKEILEITKIVEEATNAQDNW